MVAEAQSFMTIWDLSITSEFDYASGEYSSSFEPSSETLTVTFPLNVSNWTDNGTTTVTVFGGYLGASFASTLTSLVSEDPYGGGIDAPYNSYAFTSVYDYSSDFIEEFAAQRNTFSTDSTSDKWWSYHIEIRADERSDSAGGTGDADYIFTEAALLTFLEEFQANDGIAYFNESYQHYDPASSSSLGGFSWEGTASLRSVSVVPEPETYGLIFSSTLLGTVVMLRRRKRCILPFA